MSAEQIVLKKARKTGRYEVPRSSYGYAWNGDPWSEKNVPANVLAGWKAAALVRQNALLITAALNLYHEKRGSAFRHNVPECLKWSYGKLIVRLNNEINAQ